MTRAFAFLVRNWPLKLAAIVLATLLYGGVAISQNADTFNGAVPIRIDNQPVNSVIIGGPAEVTTIRYFSNDPDSVGLITSRSFIATVDLSDVVLGAETQDVFVDVQLQAIDDRNIQIIDWQPQRIALQLDPLVQKTVPVEIDRGAIPAGLVIGTAQLSEAEVTVSGAQSVVSRVTAARATVLVQASGIDVDSVVDLVAVDARGEEVSTVDLDPGAVRIQIAVENILSTKTLPVVPAVEGVPADGFQLVSAIPSPLLLSVEGPPEALEGLTRISTRPISIAGAAADLTRTVEFDLPEGVVALGSATAEVVIDLREREATRTFEAGLVPDGARPDRTYSLSAPSVLVTLAGPVRALDAITALTASLPVGDLLPGTHDVTVGLTTPPGLRLVSIGPTQVRVIVGVPPLSPAAGTPSPTPSPGP